MIRLYHGAHRWSGPPEVRALRKGHAEYGPGIYLTTGYETASAYAKGGGKVLLFTIDRLRFADAVTIRANEMLGFVGALPRVKKRVQILADIERIGQRRGGVLLAENLVNLFVNTDNASGETGVELAKWLVEFGADATLARGQGSRSADDWVALMNPRRVVSVEAVDPMKAPIDWDLPRVR